MTKKKSSPIEKSSAQPEDTPFPQLTFTEEEHQALVNLKNFISKFARFNNLDEKLIHEYARMNIAAINVIKKIEDHIFEFKRKLNSMPKGR